VKFDVLIGISVRVPHAREEELINRRKYMKYADVLAQD
jgi:hypothetical protein